MWLERLGARLESLGARHYTVGKARRWSLVYMIRKARSLTLDEAFLLCMSTPTL